MELTGRVLNWEEWKMMEEWKNEKDRESKQSVINGSMDELRDNKNEKLEVRTQWLEK